MRHLRCDAVGLLAATLALAGCAGSQDPEFAAFPAPDPTQTSDTVVVDRTAEVRELQQRVSVLQLQLLERDTQVSELQRSLNEARQEVVRVMARMQTIATRAEAASAMAEAEITMNAQESTRPASAYLAEARSLLAQASSQFNSGNYGGALYLSGQARRAVRTGEAAVPTSAASALGANETPFQMPVPVRTLRRSNLREGPSLESTVVGTLEPDTPLTGIAYTSEWMHVRDDTGRTGWVFYSLLGARR